MSDGPNLHVHNTPFPKLTFGASPQRKTDVVHVVLRVDPLEAQHAAQPGDRCGVQLGDPLVALSRLPLDAQGPGASATMDQGLPLRWVENTKCCVSRANPPAIRLQDVDRASSPLDTLGSRSIASQASTRSRATTRSISGSVRSRGPRQENTAFDLQQRTKAYDGSRGLACSIAVLVC